MTRVKRSVQKRARRKKIIKRAKGFISHRKTNFRAANEAVWHAGKHAYRGRKQKKRDFRRLWQIKIGASTRAEGISYSAFIGNLKTKKIEIDRKILAELAQKHPSAFAKILMEVKR